VEDTRSSSEAITGVVQVTGYSSLEGHVGDTVTFYGRGFTTDGYTQVNFLPKDQAFPYTDTICTSTTVCTFKVPPMAASGIGGRVSFEVVVQGGVVSTGQYSLDPVQISSFGPASVPATGGTITINGAGLFDGTYAGTQVAAGSYFTSPIRVSFTDQNTGTSFPASGLSCRYWPDTTCTVVVPPMPANVRVGEAFEVSVYAFAESSAIAQGTFSYTQPPPPPPCTPTLCAPNECTGTRSDGCGGSVTCGPQCPSGEACTLTEAGLRCESPTCPKVIHCPGGSVWADYPDCICVFHHRPGGGGGE
jgi:hypothetical protein